MRVPDTAQAFSAGEYADCFLRLVKAQPEPREARTANRGVDRKRGVGASREEAEHAEPAVLDTGQQLNDAMRTTVVSQPGASRDARSRDERSIGAFVRRTDTYDHERCQPIGVTRPATLTKFHH